jgi:ketosteroid isomerase-like protein
LQTALFSNWFSFPAILSKHLNIHPADKVIFLFYNRLATDTKKFYMETLVKQTAIASEMFDAFKRGDIETLLSYLHDDVIWTIGGSAPIPYARVYRGKEDTSTFFPSLAKAVTFHEFVPRRIEQAGDHTVVSFGYFKATVNNTGKQIESEWVMVDEFDDDGLVISFRDYVDTQAVANAFV